MISWKFINNIRHISNYKLTPKLCLVTKEGELFLNDKALSQEVEDLFLDDKFIIFNLKNKITKIISLYTSKEIAITIFKAISTKSLVKQKWAFIDSINSNSLHLYDLENDTFSFIYNKYDWEFILLTHTKLILYENTTIKSLSLETGDYQWEIDLGQYSTEKEAVKIKEILGVWQENLVVLMDNNDILVLISLKTGQIAAEIRHILAQFPKEGPWGFGWHFHLEGDYVYLLQQNRYLRIDLATQQIETLWIPENTNFNIQRVSYDSEYAYFMACDGYHVYTDILGVFDRKALKIAWQHTEPIYSSHPPQSDGKKLYCLDNEGTLHIFERESEG